MKQTLLKLLADDAAHAATEYAVMISLIIIVAFLAITQLGGKVDTVFRAVAAIE